MTKISKNRRLRQTLSTGRQTQTLRQKTEKASEIKQPKKRRLHKSAKRAAKPFRFLRFLRYIIPPYFRNSWKELKQVTWLSRKETWQLTFAVFIFASVFGLVVAITDYGLDKIFKRILLNL